MRLTKKEYEIQQKLLSGEIIQHPKKNRYLGIQKGYYCIGIIENGSFDGFINHQYGNVRQALKVFN